MATTPLDPLAILDSLEIQNSSSITAGKTANKKYNNLLKYLNVTSYSQLQVFYRCPRKFQMAKERAAFHAASSDFDTVENVDFAFGHAVGAGIQNFMIHKDLNKALFNATLAWTIDFDGEIKKKKKSLTSAMIAVEKFVYGVVDGELGDWELLYLPNSKPAVETAVELDCGNGFKHYLHMDLALRNKYTKKIAVVDCKTTGLDGAEEAMYANSPQALSYAIPLEAALPEELVDYDVMYAVYSSSAREWSVLTFTKSVLDQAEYIKDLLLTQDQIKMYADLGFFPKRGDACFDYFRRCEFFGECNLTADQPLPTLEVDKSAETVDYSVSLDDVIATIKQRKRK